MQRTPPKSKTLSDENPFSLSLGDLMAGLLLIFVLVLAFLMLNLREQEDRLLKIVKAYREMRVDLSDDLDEEFEEDFKKWGVELDPKDASIRFTAPEVLFETGSAVVRQHFKDILNDFFPRYVKILTKDKYKKEIIEIRIEGHTSSRWEGVKDKEEIAYILNMKLSQDRTRSVLEYILKIQHSEIIQNIEWIRDNLTANGLSSSKLILNDDRTQNPEKSRRVEFRVRTNAEKLFDKLLEKNRGLR